MPEINCRIIVTLCGDFSTDLGLEYWGKVRSRAQLLVMGGKRRLKDTEMVRRSVVMGLFLLLESFLISGLRVS